MGYFFGHVIFYVFIKAKKKNPSKDITDFFEKYKQKMSEKPRMVDEFQGLKLDEAEKPTSVGDKERVNPGKEFLLKLEQKVSLNLRIALLKLM